MNTRSLEESTRLVDSLSWSAIAFGTFIALSVQSVLLMLGLALATSTGDEMPGGGFNIWMVVVELVAIAVGAALTARLSHVDRRSNGIAAGVMTWAVVLVLGGVFQGLTMTRALGGSGAWAMLIGAVVSLVAAMIGGAFGASLGGSSRGSLTPPESRRYDESRQPAPVH